MKREKNINTYTLMSTLMIKKLKENSPVKSEGSNRTEGGSANARHAASADCAKQAASGITGAVRIKNGRKQRFLKPEVRRRGGETWRLQSGYERER